MVCTSGMLLVRLGKYLCIIITIPLGCYPVSPYVIPRLLRKCNVPVQR